MHGHMGPGSSPCVLQIGDEPIVVTGNGFAIRTRDGYLVGKVEGDITATSTWSAKMTSGWLPSVKMAVAYSACD